MACSLQPSVTLWGTTQILQTTSYYTTWTTVSPQVPGVDFVDGKPDLKGPLQTQTLSSLVETVVTLPSVVPQKTLYYPCTETQGQAPAPVASQAQTSTTAAPPAPYTTPASAAHTTTTPAAVSSSTGPGGASTTTGTALSTTHVGTQSTAPAGTTRRPPTGGVTSEPGTGTFAPTSADPSDTAVVGAGSTATESSSSSTVPLAAGIAGAVVGIVLLILLFLWCRRGRQRKDTDEWDEDTFDEKPVARGRHETDGDYWERKFQEIESGSPHSAARGGASPQSAADSETKRVRLTLDLHSKRLTNRPLSTLTAISAFLARTLPIASCPVGPEPVSREVAEDPDGQKYNFSRPLRAVNPDPDDTTPSTVGPVNEGSSLGSSRPSSLVDAKRASRLSQIVPLTFKRISTTFSSSPFDPFLASTNGSIEPSTSRNPNEARAGPHAIEWVQSAYGEHGDNAYQVRDPSHLDGGLAAAALPRQQGRSGPVPPRPRRDDRRPPEAKDRDLIISAQDKRDKSRRQLEAGQRQELAMDIGGDRRPSVTSLGDSTRLTPMYTEPLKDSEDDQSGSKPATARASTATFGPTSSSGSSGTLTPPRASHRPPQLSLSTSNSSTPDTNRISLYEAGVSVFSPDTEVGPNGPRNSFGPGVDGADDDGSVIGGTNRSSDPFRPTQRVRWLSGSSK